MSVFNFASLIVRETRATFFAKLTEIGDALDLAVSTWREGDPSRTILYLLSIALEQLEEASASFAESAFLDTAQGDWLTVKAWQDFEVSRNPATYAEATGTLTNALGFSYTLDPGDLIVSSSTSGITYRNTDTVTIGPGPATTVSCTVRADVEGSEGNASTGDIDTMVSSYTGLSFVSTSDAVGQDLEAPASLILRCRAKLAALSPNGARDAYYYVATTAELNGGAEVTRAQTVGDTPTGEVSLYLATASGAASGGDVTLVEEAVVTHCLPWTVTPLVDAATEVSGAVSCDVWVHADAGLEESDVEDLVEAAVQELYRTRPVGGDKINEDDANGRLFFSLLVGTILGAHPRIYRVVMTTPTDDIVLEPGEVAVLAGVTTVVHIVEASP